jgi:uncharacterized protein
MKKRTLFFALLIVLLSCSSKNDYNNIKVPVYSQFSELPVNSVKPHGWLKKYLENQRDGLTGYLEAAGFPFDSFGWGERIKDTNTWWPYEQTGYWIDGMTRCGYLLNDTFLLNKALEKIHRTLADVDSSGFIGPKQLLKDGKGNRWPHAVFFRSLMACYSATGDKRILDAVLKHYHKKHFDLCSEREQVNIENILWFYSRTGDTSLLNLAKEIYHCYNDEKFKDELLAKKSLLSGQLLNVHGVSFNEVTKLSAIMYIYTGDTAFLNVSVSAYKMIEKYCTMIDGVHISSEFLHTPPDALQTHETCDIVDFTWSLGYMLMATGDASYADKIEKAMFNAAPGCVSKDFKSLQYFSGPNQVLATNSSNHNHYCKGNLTMRYAPAPWPETPCCPGNVNRAMPNFASRLWMTTKEGNIVAAMYAPCELNCKVGDEEISIEEKTNYPFDEKVSFVFNTDLKAPFILRIPSWCSKPEIVINDKKENIGLKPGAFVKLERKITKGDVVTLMLPQEPRISRWPENGIAVERGPLVYSLDVKGKWTVIEDKKNSTPDFPAWSAIADSPWNYALCAEKPESLIFKSSDSVSENPWENPPFEILAPAKRVKGWEIIKQDTVMNERWAPVMENGKEVWGLRENLLEKGDYAFSPKLPDLKFLKKNIADRIETIKLVPYGCTRLRITIFPDGEKAK